MDKILVLGGSGLVGNAIINEMSQYKDYEIYATYFNGSVPLRKDKSFKLDIEIKDNISEILTEIQPKAIISCLRGDFSNQLILHKTVAEYLKGINGKMYFLSTTNVFDNDFSKFHYEYDVPDSCSDYGKYKIECEESISKILDDNCSILRIPQVWGRNSPRMKELLKSLDNNEKIAVYPKLFLNTNTDVMIAKQIAYIIKQNLKGIFHLAADDKMSHKDFLTKLIFKLGYDNVMIEEKLDMQGKFVILSKRNNKFPKKLLITNKSVIEYLVNSNSDNGIG